jgi:hypothetical protein
MVAFGHQKTTRNAMRHILIMTSALSLLAAAPALAQTEKLLADANNDGKISLAEYQNHRATLMKADRDKDGKISPAEWQRGAAYLRASLAGADGAEMIGKGGGFQAMDTNKDSFVSDPEIRAWAALRFPLFDANKDGFVSRQEGERALQQARNMR